MWYDALASWLVLPRSGGGVLASGTAAWRSAASIDLTRQDPLWFVGILGMVLWLAWLVAVSLVLLLVGRGDRQTGHFVSRA